VVEEVHKPVAAKPVAARRGYFLPTWALGGIFTACLGAGGAALNVWKNDTLRENQIATIMTNQERLIVKTDRTEGKVDLQAGKITHLETDQAHFQSLVIDKIDTLLSTDRFRKKW
jgi:hypothetical protein